jgi:hypothetical protein
MMFLFIFYMWFFSNLLMTPVVDTTVLACAAVATLGTIDFIWITKRLIS